MAIAFDPTLSPQYYKVIHPIPDFNRPRKRDPIIEIYSSETGKWRVYTISYDPLWAFNKVTYWNSAIHWINFDKSYHFNLALI